MRCLALLTAALPAVLAISIPVANNVANDFAERDADSASFKRENGLCCGTHGYDTGTKAYFYKLDKKLATRESCGARCLNDSKCVSFAFGNGICLGYDVAAEGNVHPYKKSPYAFFERRCQTGADPSYTSSAAPAATSSPSQAGSNPSATPSVPQYCGAYGYDRNSPLAFEVSKDHCSPDKCSAYCQSKSKCKSFAVGKGQCLLYDAPVRGSNFNKVPTSPYRFYDKSCDTSDSSSSSTPSYTPTPGRSSASSSGAVATQTPISSSTRASSPTSAVSASSASGRASISSSANSYPSASGTSIAISSTRHYYSNSSSTLSRPSFTSSASSIITPSDTPSASPTPSASESASGSATSSSPSQTPLAPGCEGKTLYYIRGDSPPSGSTTPRFWGYIQNTFESTGLRGVFDGKTKALIVCHNVPADVAVGTGQELISTNTAKYPDLDRVGFVVGGPSESDFSPDKLGFAYMTATKSLPAGPAVDGESSYNRDAQANKQVAASLWTINQGTGVIVPQWINQNGVPASSELLLFGTTYSFYAQPIVTLASSKAAYDYEYGRFGTSSVVLRLERVVG